MSDCIGSSSDKLPFPVPRRLVEECEIVSVFVLRRMFGKEALLRTIRQSRPLLPPVNRGQLKRWTLPEIRVTALSL
jgi:hypothetical protein